MGGWVGRGACRVSGELLRCLISPSLFFFSVVGDDDGGGGATSDVLPSVRCLFLLFSRFETTHNLAGCSMVV